MGSKPVVTCAAAASVTPVFVTGNTTCAEQGIAAGMKMDPPSAGTYPIGNGTVTFTSDGTYIHWTSTIGIR